MISKFTTKVHLRACLQLSRSPSRMSYISCSLAHPTNWINYICMTILSCLSSKYGTSLKLQWPCRTVACRLCSRLDPTSCKPNPCLLRKRCCFSVWEGSLEEDFFTRFHCLGRNGLRRSSWCSPWGIVFENSEPSWDLSLRCKQFLQLWALDF